MKDARNRTRRLTLLSLMVALALILSYVESKIPAFVAIPGVKVGLANIVVILALYKLGAKEAAAISGVRILIVSMLFGNAVSWVYSVTGAIFSFAVMLLLKKLTPLNEVTVSVAGGVMHNVGQIIAACMLMETAAVMYYLPFLIVSGVIAGIAVGIAAALLIKRVKI